MTRSTHLRGFTLLPVVLAMSIVAAVAFVLNRDNGLNARMNTQQADAARARYAAEAGLQAANAVIQAAGCSGAYPVSGTPVTNADFGGASYSAYSTSAGGSPIKLVSTGKYNGASVTLERENVYVYQPRANTVIQPGPPGYDTYVNVGQSRNFGGDSRLRLQTSQYQPLVKFSLANFPPGSRVVPWFDGAKLQPGAKMSLYQYDIASSGTGSLKINAQLITQSWVAGTKSGGGTPDGATWTTYDGTNLWPSAGIGYAPTPVASTPYTGVIGWVDWEVTNAAAGWIRSPASNHGIWLIETGGSLGNTAYVSSNDNANATLRPKLTVSYQLPCGTSLGLALNPSVDTYLDSGNNVNFGAATVLPVSYKTPGPDRRILLRFDVTPIPPGANLKSAILRLYCNVTSATNNPKAINAWYVTSAWVEGVATWTTRTAGVNWTIAGGDYYASWSAPAKEEASGLTLPGTFRQGWITFEIKDLAQYWSDNRSNAAANNGVELIFSGSGSISDVVECDSRESASGKGPQLVVLQ